MATTDIVEIEGNVVNPYTTAVPDNTAAALAQGRNGELLVAMAHGKYFTAAARGALFSYNVTGVTIPKNAATLVSVFSLYNPVGSGRLLELVTFDLGVVSATTVVDTTGLYSQTAVLTAKGTFTTAATPIPALLNSGLAGVGVPYSAFTHSGTPVRVAILATFGAITTTTNQLAHYDFDGKIVIPPGSIVSVANVAAASNATSCDINMSWLETPLV